MYGAAGLEKEAYDKAAPIIGTSCTTRDIAVQPLTPTNKWGGNWKIDYAKPCAQAYIDSIAARYASWGIDFVKIDGVEAANVPDIKAWSQAIDRTGRQMWLSASAWPVELAAGDGLRPWANGVRIDTDIECYCDTTATWANSVDDRFSDLPNWLSKLDPPGYFPDLDAMPINNNTGSGLQDGLNDVERQTVMTFWSMASSPLYVGGDVYFMDDKAISILSNPEVIAVDQASVLPIQVNGQVWKKVVGDSTYVAVYNLGSSPADVTVDFADLGISGRPAVRDVAARTDLGAFAGRWTAAAVPAHGSRLIKISAVGSGTGFEAEAGALAGPARVSGCPACSGGKKAGYLGNGGSVTIGGVPGGGSRTVRFTYVSGDPRPADISVNGGAPIRVDFASTGSWNSVGVKDVTLTLPNATNSITIGGSAYAPDIDRIDL
ncbi:hypothetical protein HNR40_009573 [Nonomuraea endophytica]|uniref:CBM6 domain-containing protein n=1 Tax=Nonomuraea endophytica TaxID=714136 RepID=A0A7W8AF95_9ACTN|nr:hypothetical protein [Nonomuraea endophytica]